MAWWYVFLKPGKQLGFSEDEADSSVLTQIAADTRATSGPIVADKVQPTPIHSTIPSRSLTFCLPTELREAALHRAQDLVCRSRYRGRH
jgi:hypothetical protein